MVNYSPERMVFLGVMDPPDKRGLSADWVTLYEITKRGLSNLYKNETIERITRPLPFLLRSFVRLKSKAKNPSSPRP